MTTTPEAVKKLADELEMCAVAHADNGEAEYGKLPMAAAIDSAPSPPESGSWSGRYRTRSSAISQTAL